MVAKRNFEPISANYGKAHGNLDIGDDFETGHNIRLDYIFLIAVYWLIILQNGGLCDETYSAFFAAAVSAHIVR